MTDEQTIARRAIADLEREFGLMVTRVRNRVRKRAAQVHPELQPGTYKVLSTLVHVGPMHAGALANQLAVDKSSVSRSVKQLQELGLASREVDPTDGRAWIIAATPEAIERVQRISRVDQERLHRRLLGWDVGDVERLATLLARLNETSDDDDPSPAGAPDRPGSSG